MNDARFVIPTTARIHLGKADRPVPTMADSGELLNRHRQLKICRVWLILITRLASWFVLRLRFRLMFQPHYLRSDRKMLGSHHPLRGFSCHHYWCPTRPKGALRSVFHNGPFSHIGATSSGHNSNYGWWMKWELRYLILPSLRLIRVAGEAGEVVQQFFRTPTEVRAFAEARGRPAHAHNPS